MKRKWEWCVRSYKDGKLMLETVHIGEFSKDMEVRAAQACGYEVTVEDLRENPTAHP